MLTLRLILSALRQGTLFLVGNGFDRLDDVKVCDADRRATERFWSAPCIEGEQLYAYMNRTHPDLER